MKNKYVKRSKISEAKFRKIIMCFAMELDSQRIATLTSLNRNTVNRYLARVRDRMAALCEAQALKALGGNAQAAVLAHPADRVNPLTTEESSLLVFGITSYQNHIHTEILTKAIYRRLKRLIQGKPHTTPLTLNQEQCPYDAIVDLNGRWHYRLNQDNARGNSMPADNGTIEAFLGYARKRLTTVHLNGCDHFYHYLKECEFRFNHRDADLYKLLLKDFREHPLS
jgi:hypothetical protein